MARPKVREVSAPERIVGVAAPVNTYVRPADPPRSGLHDLAEGLAVFDRGLSNYMASQKADTEANEKAQAVADFHRNNQEGYAEAVRQGLIPATASKTYVESYKRQQGNLVGLKLADKFAIDYRQWEGRSRGNPGEYAAWQAQWMKENVGAEQDPEILRGLAPHLEQIAGSGYDRFNKDRDETLRNNAQATSGALITDAMRRQEAQNTAEGTTDYEAFWGNVMRLREEAIGRGDKAEDFDALLAQNIILTAEETNQLDILKVLDKKLPGKDTPMSYDPAIRAARLKAEDHIKSQQAANSTEIARRQEELEKRQQNAWLEEATSLLASGEKVPEELITNLSRRNGKIRYELQQMREAFESAEQDEDQGALMEAYSRIDQGATAEFIIGLSKSGVIRKASTFKDMMDRAAKVREANGAGGVFQSPTYKDTVKFITNATSGGPLSALSNEKELSAEGMEALYDYRQMLLDWNQRNPDASMLEKEKAAREAGDIIRGRMKGPDDGMSPKSYESDADRAAGASAPPPRTEVAPPAAPAQTPQREEGMVPYLWRQLFGGEAPAQEAPAAPQSAPQAAPQPEAAPIQPRSEAPPLESLTPARRQAVEALAKRKGWTVEEANRRVHEQLMQRQQEVTPPAGDGLGPRGDISTETRTKLAALLQDPPKVQQLAASNVPVAPLLNLIGHTEGTDRGQGYNETLSYGAYTGGPVNLVGMTLGELDKLQTDMLRHPNNTLNSSAVGRYQIVRTTLRSIKQEMGLSDDELFTPELQDRMAMHLLERRGLSKWQAGRMSDEQFMAGLSAEWASLPRANGKGTYNQRIGANAKTVKDTLDKSRG